MILTKERIGATVQILAYVSALLSIWGWLFWLGAETSGVTLAQLRVDSEFDSMIAIADLLAWLAPVALICGLAALIWPPRYIAFGAIILGVLGTAWLTFGV